MRVLFVSGVSVGGAARSTHELAAELRRRGHSSATLMKIDEDVETTERHKRALNATVKAGRSPLGRLALPAIERHRRSIGRDRVVEPGHEHPAWRAAQPENAFVDALADVQPDLVVVNSIERPAWRMIRDECRRRSIPTVLYLREATGVRHLVDPPAPPDVLLANAEAHAIEARAVGFECAVVPSMVDTQRCVVEPTRDRVVMVNPVAIYGIDLALAIAEACPDIPFTFVESWPLDDTERAELLAACDRLGNAQLVPFCSDPRDVYRPARVLLMLCTVPSRPRVVLEAQASGIPVIAVDRPGHGEVVGPGGVLVAPGAELSEWAAAVRRMFEDPDHYAGLVQAAQTHAARHDATPDAVATAFERAVAPLLAQVQP